MFDKKGEISTRNPDSFYLVNLPCGLSCLETLEGKEAWKSLRTILFLAFKEKAHKFTKVKTMASKIFTSIKFLSTKKWEFRKCVLRTFPLIVIQYMHVAKIS